VGVCPNWSDYPEEVKRRVIAADKICYPGPVYEEILRAAGRNIFPKNYYPFLGNKIAQTNLFQLLGVPHPRTGIYYGRNNFERICRDFPFPFVCKTPVGSSRGEGVFLIPDPSGLLEYLKEHNPAYIQEYLPIERDLRAVVVTGKVVHAYWRVHREGDFRNNVAQGGAVSFDEIPDPALQFARSVAAVCGFDEVGLDICEYGGEYYILEANMVFGLEGFKQKEMDIYALIAELLDTDR
jgi:ribosomal protein S6--L-glutamate ligase